MAKRKRRKVALPTDRTGTPIRVGDVLEWEDGMRLRVDVLNWYGGGFLTAEDCDSDEFSDNLKASVVVWRKGHK